ncbi:MAG TPA: GNAT family N-acetyltransferase [Gemmatimonadales bacterium]|nr:GNAT family N-acetyltransferase [Gemmatimonadales bacterium]
MWRPERGLVGPDPATVRDIEPLNRLFTEAFTDRYARDGLAGVRVPALSHAVWRYAIEDAGAGAMLWRDAEGHLVAFNMAHRSGAEGWMGPIAVRPDRQGGGVGRVVVRAGVEWLRAQGATVVGLETMPRTVDNIGFYSALGFRPARLTVTMVRDAVRQPVRETERLSRGDVPRLVAECAALARSAAPGLDFSAQLQLTLEHGVGDATLVRQDGRLAAFALWHWAPLAANRPRDEGRVLKLVARDLRAFERLVDALQADALAERLRRVAIRCQTAFGDAYALLVQRGFRVHWTDLRMTLPTHPEQPVTGPAVVMSNWEI